jgi:hypothetical protein
LQTFLPHANGCHISIASRFAASPVFEIKDCNATDQVIANPQFVQGTLFSS